MSQNYSLHFFLKRPKNYSEGEVPIYMRITVTHGGTPKEASAGRMVDHKHWESSVNRAKGNSESARNLNSYLNSIERKVESIHTELKKFDKEITCESMMNKYQNKGEKKYYLLEILQEHNDKMKALLGNGFKENTLKGYLTSLKHLTNYIRFQYKKSDIEAIKINYAFVTNYDFFLRKTVKCSDISVAKYMKHLRKIINLCLAHKWISDNPFAAYKNSARPKERDFLTKEELRSIRDKEFIIQRLDQVRDIFVFCCYTGLSYADVRKLKRAEIRKGDDGKLWIFTKREKTLTSSHVPLVRPAQALYDKYTDHPTSEHSGLAFPVLSNQNMNGYLKELADLCGVQKQLTFHIARHTFATTVTLGNDVPIESVSRMLGHKDIKTTMHYAKILNSKISRDMGMLDEKLSEGEF